VFHLFNRYILRPENQVRWRWTPGDVVVFDNRNTTHYAPDDFGSNYRELHRVTAAGDVPVGVDGGTSYVIAGDQAEDYSPVV
jgi:taurine dioxygenase